MPSCPSDHTVARDALSEPCDSSNPGASVLKLKSLLPSGAALLPLDGTKPGQWCVALVAEDGGRGLSVHEMGELGGFVIQLIVGCEPVQLTLSAARVVVVGAEAGVTGNF